MAQANISRMKQDGEKCFIQKLYGFRVFSNGKLVRNSYKVQKMSKLIFKYFNNSNS